MKLMPNSTTRRSVASALLRSSGGPQIPFPVIRIAPNPRRWAVMSPPSEIVPACEAKDGPAAFAIELLPELRTQSNFSGVVRSAVATAAAPCLCPARSACSGRSGQQRHHSAQSPLPVLLSGGFFGAARGHIQCDRKPFALAASVIIENALPQHQLRARGSCRHSPQSLGCTPEPRLLLSERSERRFPAAHQIDIAGDTALRLRHRRLHLQRIEILSCHAPDIALRCEDT